jgi:hypothetical protein
MKAASISHLKNELKSRPPQELMEICLRLARFRKENKELVTYLLFEAGDENAYIDSIKAHIDSQFAEINKSNVYYAGKGIRKILKVTNKFIRFSGKTETEVELRMHFCAKLNEMKFLISGRMALMNLYSRQIQNIKKAMSKLHEDLQFDYENELRLLL